MKKFKMPTAYTTMFFIIIVIAILTWIIPAGQYDYVDPDASKLEPIPGTYKAMEQNPQGIWEIIYAPIKGFYDAMDIELFVLIIGGFLAVVMKTGAIDSGIANVVQRLKGKEKWMIPILMVLFGLGGTTYGMAEETIAFYPLVIPVIIAAGYDAITAVAVIALGAGLGVLGSTVNPFATGIASGFAGISVGSGIVLRALILVLAEATGIIYVMRYAERVKRDPSKSIIADLVNEHKEAFLGNKQKNEIIELTKNRKSVLWVFALTFLIMILAVIPWAWKFNITIFESLNNAILNIPVLGSLIGKTLPLGDWWFGEISMLFLVSSIIIAKIYGMKEQDYMEAFVDGARDLLGVALIIGVSRGITVVMNDGGMTATVLSWGEKSLSQLGSVSFVNLTYLFYLPMSFLIPSTSGLATLTMPIMAPLADFAGVGRDIVITAYQSASGIINLFTPTSGVIMGALAIAKVPYERYFKYVWKLLIIVSLMVMVVMSLAVML